MAKNCSNEICRKLVKWLDRGRCKVCAKYHRRHNVDRTSLDMRKNKPKKDRERIAPIEYVCVKCGIIEIRRKRGSLFCKRCQTNNNSKRYRDLHPEKRRDISKNYRQTHRTAYLNTLKRARDKRRSTEHGVLEHRMEVAIRQVLQENKNKESWQKLVGYSVQDLRSHLESQFSRDMSWDLFLDGEIEIDHKIPKKYFIYSSPQDEQFKICWSLDNLQPLWKLDNRRKSAKLGWEANRV